MIRLRTILSSMALAAFTALASAAPKPSVATEAAKTRKIIADVNNKWQKDHSPETNAFWDNAAYHTANMEAYRLVGNPAWLDYSIAWADHNQWKGAKGTDRSR